MKRAVAVGRMRIFLSGVLGLGLSVTLSACAPSAGQLKKVMEENPDILYAAMKKDPAQFMDVINQVAESARGQKENQQFEEGFKNPMKAEIDEKRTFDGDMSAKVTIVEYSDFQCPYCSRGHETMKQVLKAFPGQVRILFKNYPIERIHPQAMRISQYYEAIGTTDKSKASQFKSMIFSNQEKFNPSEAERKIKSQDELMKKYNARVEADLQKMVKELGLNAAEVKKVADSDAVRELISKDQEEAQNFGFTGTPGYLVNGVPVRGAYPFDTFKMVIERHLAAMK